MESDQTQRYEQLASVAAKTVNWEPTEHQTLQSVIPWMATEILRLRRKIEIASGELMNAQPHIAQLDENERQYVDCHINMAMDILGQKE